MSVELMSAYITAGGSIISAVLAAAAVAVIGKRFLSQEKLKAQLEESTKDIAFLLKVEKEHCKLHKGEKKGKSHFLSLMAKLYCIRLVGA